MRYIVHRGSGTIVAADECVIVDTDLDVEEDETEILGLADSEGVPVA